MNTADVSSETGTVFVVRPTDIVGGNVTELMIVDPKKHVN